MHLPFGVRAWKPAFPGAMLAAGHFLERGLLVRSGGVAQGAAHAPALRRAGLEARGPREFPRAGMPVAPCGRLSMRLVWRLFVAARLPAPTGAGARSPPHPRSERGGVPLQNATPRSGHAQGLANGFLEGVRAWKPAFPGAMLAAGHFLERGLLVRSGGVAQGAAHAPALRRAGLEARGPRKTPTGRDARGTLALHAWSCAGAFA